MYIYKVIMTYTLNLFPHAKWMGKISCSILTLSENLNSSSQHKQKKSIWQKAEVKWIKDLQSPDSYTILLKILDLEMSFNLSHRTQKKTQKGLLSFFRNSKAKFLYLENYDIILRKKHKFFPLIFSWFFFLLTSFHLFCHFYCACTSRNRV